MVFGERAREVAMRLRVPSQEHQPRGADVEAVHEEKSSAASPYGNRSALRQSGEQACDRGVRLARLVARLTPAGLLTATRRSSAYTIVANTGAACHTVATLPDGWMLELATGTGPP